MDVVLVFPVLGVLPRDALVLFPRVGQGLGHVAEVGAALLGPLSAL